MNDKQDLSNDEYDFSNDEDDFSTASKRFLSFFPAVIGSFDTGSDFQQKGNLSIMPKSKAIQNKLKILLCTKKSFFFVDFWTMLMKTTSMTRTILMTTIFIRTSQFYCKVNPPDKLCENFHNYSSEFSRVFFLNFPPSLSET